MTRGLFFALLRGRNLFCVGIIAVLLSRRQYSATNTRFVPRNSLFAAVVFGRKKMAPADPKGGGRGGLRHPTAAPPGGIPCGGLTRTGRVLRATQLVAARIALPAIRLPADVLSCVQQTPVPKLMPCCTRFCYKTALLLLFCLYAWVTVKGG